MFSFLLEALLALHVAAGVLSLVLFWLPIITKKGRTAHRRIGLVYVYAMSVVIASALILSSIHLLSGDTVGGLAFLFLSVLTMVPLVSGVQVLKAKRPTPGYRRLRMVLAGVLFAVSVVLLVGWQVRDSGLLLGFGIIGLLGSGNDFRQFVRVGGSGKTWLREHYEAMLFSGAAAYTAFFVIGGQNLLLLTGWWTLAPWVLPTLLTVALLPLVHRRFKQQKNNAERAQIAIPTP